MVKSGVRRLDGDFVLGRYQNNQYRRQIRYKDDRSTSSSVGTSLDGGRFDDVEDSAREDLGFASG